MQNQPLNKSQPFSRRKLLLGSLSFATVSSLLKTNALANQSNEPNQPNEPNKPKTPGALTARDVADVFEQIAPISSGIPKDELGFVYGDPATELTGIACMWDVDASSITAAAKQNLNMIICHEIMFLWPQKSPWYKGPNTQQIKPNQIRRSILEQNKMVVYRSHSNWDALPNDGQPDQAVKALGIEGLTVAAKQKFFKVHRLPQEMTITELKDHAQKGLNFNSCRIFGNPDKKIRQFAFLIGGFGENQVHMPQAAMEMGAEAIIIGDMSEFVVIAALEMGMPVIETSHSVSENPGIRRQAEILSQKFPSLNVKYIPSGAFNFNFDYRTS